MTTPSEPDLRDRAAAAVDRCREIADKYREIAAEVDQLTQRMEALNNATVTDPEDYLSTAPHLLSAPAARYEAGRMADRMQATQLALLARAGAWEAQRERFRQLED